MDSKVNFGNIVHILSLIKENKTFNLDELCQKTNLSLEKLLYSLSVLSEVYSANGATFVDFEINTKENNITFEFDDTLLNIQTITNLELFKIYNLLNNPKINIANLFENNSDLTFLYDILNNYFKSHQPLPKSSNLDFNDLLVSDEIYIEYIKLGHTIPNIYKIKPLSFSNTDDGDILEAYDYDDEKIKTFLIERITNIPENRILKENFSSIEHTIEVKYVDKFSNTLSKSFRSLEIAVEHFLKNIDSQNVIAPNSVKVEIENKKNQLINELSE